MRFYFIMGATAAAASGGFAWAGDSAAAFGALLVGALTVVCGWIAEGGA